MSKKLISVSAVFMILAICMAFTVSAATAKVAKVTGTKNDGSPVADQAGYELSKVGDGDLLTRWGGANASNNGDHVAAIFELEKEEIIASLDVSFFRGHERVHTIALEVSADGRTWKEVPLTTNKSVPNPALLTPAQAADNEAGSYLFNFPLVTATSGKFWKIKVYQREDAPGGVPNGAKNDTFSIYEVLMNIGAAPATTTAPTATTAAPAATTVSGGSAPKTGDAMGHAILIAVMALTGFGTAFILNKKIPNTL